MAARIPGFKGEYLWEIEIAEHHLRALAEAVPGEKYSWRPVERARSVSGVFVHIAGGNFLLLDMVGVPAPGEWYPAASSPPQPRFFDLIACNQALEKTIGSKQRVVRMLDQSLVAVRDAFAATTSEELERTSVFFGEETTVRRAYLRMLAHTHEHMGQLIGYLRMMGMNAPWADPAEFVAGERR